MSHRIASMVLGLTLSIATTRAHALTQPDGTTIPVPRSNLAQDLQTILTSRGETAIQVQRDAAVTPQTFNPSCNLTFTVVTRGTAAFQSIFGWYNATGSRPADSDLHVLIPCGATAGMSFPLDVRHDPTYRGGPVGFFLRTPESHSSQGSCANGDCCATLTHEGYTYYSERAFNPDNTGANSYIHLLIYDSSVTAQAFYFAWEDLFGGGDNEFADFVAEVTGIQCAGGGGACNTGMQGICAAGTLECHNGTPMCRATTTPRAESCNGLDDNCNGMIDDGMGLCPGGQVCDRGVCVPTCVEGSCFAGQTCSAAGACVETACVHVTCASGDICLGGTCVGACDGVMCPAGQTCRSGRCVDPCNGVTCDTGSVCVDGVCAPPCSCRGCATGQVCESTGQCNACHGVTCSAGMICTSAGTCVDPCAGAVCPRGQVCTAGACVDGAPDGGVLDGGGIDGGPSRDGGRAMDASRDGAADGGPSHQSGGCGCHAPGALPSRAAWAPVIGALLFVARRRRRPR